MQAWGFLQPSLRNLPAAAPSALSLAPFGSQVGSPHPPALWPGDAQEQGVCRGEQEPKAACLTPSAPLDLSLEEVPTLCLSEQRDVRARGTAVGCCQPTSSPHNLTDVEAQKLEVLRPNVPWEMVPLSRPVF